MDFYNQLIYFKSTNKYSYKKLGEPVNMSADAIRMAIDRKSLSQLQIDKLKETFNIENEQLVLANDEAADYKTGLDRFHPLELVEYIYKNKEEFFELLSFRELVKDLAVEKKMANLEEQVSLLKSTLENYLAKK